MISHQIIQKSMTELKNITGVEFCVLDTSGQCLFGDPELYSVDMAVVMEFVNSEADSQAIGNVRFLKTGSEEDGLYIVVTQDNENAYILGKIAISQLKQLNEAYQDKMDNPEMLELSDNCTEVQEQMQNIQSDIDSMKKQVEAELPEIQS